MLNERFGYNIQIRPIGGDEISQRFNSDSYGLYSGVIRTEERTDFYINDASEMDNTARYYQLSRPAHHLCVCL